MTTLTLVSDIFGRTKALEKIGKEISGADIRIIDPYQGVDHLFETEAHAYEHFMGRVGLKKYSTMLMDHLVSSDPYTVLIGFSVGASAIWEISGQPLIRRIQKAFCFYGSQIRHNTGIEPLFDMELIFPEHESHFDVDEIISIVKTKERVMCKKTNGMHGFMNELSTHFDPACYETYIRYLKTSLIRLMKKT